MGQIIVSFRFPPLIHVGFEDNYIATSDSTLVIDDVVGLPDPRMSPKLFLMIKNNLN